MQDRTLQTHDQDADLGLGAGGVNGAIELDHSLLVRLAARAPLTAGYHFEPIGRDDVGALTARVAEWFPDISVGGASCYMRPSFYLEKVLFPDSPRKDHIVLLLKHADELVGMFACELDHQTQSVYASLGIAAPEHRGARLAQAGMTITENLARHLGFGFVFGFATLKNPYAQRAFERAGWQLVGFNPGYDRELIAPGVVKRVFEAIYAKVLVGASGLLEPQPHNLTPRTRLLFDTLFSDCKASEEDGGAGADLLPFAVGRMASGLKKRGDELNSGNGDSPQFEAC